MATADLKQFKNYRIKRLLGKGGMAEVYLAYNTDLQKEITELERRQPATSEEKIKQDQEVLRLRKRLEPALKVMLSGMADDANFKRRFIHELEAHSSLHHPNIIEVFDGGDHEGRLYMVMEFVDGWTLQNFFRNYGKVPVPVAIHIGIEVLKGLQCTHEAKVIHRDIKPANVMISRSAGDVKIADFGIVKGADLTMLTQSGEIVGTPAYMSPEQALGKDIGHQTDIYSTGVMLYELLTAVNPFLGETVQSTIMNVINGKCRMIQDLEPTVPDKLQEVIHRMIAKDKTIRSQSCAEVIADLEEVAGMYGTLATTEYFKLYCTNPSEFTKNVRTFMADKHMENARKIYDKNKNYIGYALLELRRSLAYDPSNEAAQAFVKRLCAKRKINFEAVRGNQLDELEAKLAKDPENYSLLMQIAKTHQSQGNFFEALSYFRKLLILKPNDGYVEIQLNLLLGKGTGKERKRSPNVELSVSMVNKTTPGGLAPKTTSLAGLGQAPPSSSPNIAEESTRIIERKSTSPKPTPSPGAPLAEPAPSNFSYAKAAIEDEWSGSEVDFKTALKDAIPPPVPAMRRGGQGFSLGWLMGILVLGAIGGTGYWQHDRILPLISRLTPSKPVEVSPLLPPLALFDTAEKEFQRANYAEAEKKFKAFEDAYLRSPALVQTRYRRALILYDGKQEHEALKVLNTIPVPSGDFETEIQAGSLKVKIFSHQGRKKEIRDTFDALFQRRKEFGSTESYYAFVLEYGKLLEELNEIEALQLYNTFQQEKAAGGKFPELHKRRAALLSHLGNKQEADAALNQALEEAAPGSELYKEIEKMIEIQIGKI